MSERLRLSLLVCLLLALCGCAYFPFHMASGSSAASSAAPAYNPALTAAAPQAAQAPAAAAATDSQPNAMDDAEGDGAEIDGAAQIEEEPLVSEELPPTNPDAVLSSNSAEAGRLREQARKIEGEIKHEISFDIPIVLNERVAYFLDYFQTAVHNKFSLWLGRSTTYLPRMQQIFREQGLPEDLAYLALIESGFNPRAYSRSAAVGCWQFIGATGARYGLRQNWWIDERRDPEKATYAAATYLTDLYTEFGSWYLAAAAYNCGEGHIRRVVRRFNTNDFWEICNQQAVAAETRDYVPKMIAAILIAKEPAKYGFGDICYEAPWDYETVGLPHPSDISLVAELCNSDRQVIKEMNPELRHNWTPRRLTSTPTCCASRPARASGSWPAWPSARTTPPALPSTPCSRVRPWPAWPAPTAARVRPWPPSTTCARVAA